MTRYILLQWEQEEWRVMGYPQMRYPNMFTSKDDALDAAWGLYEGYNEGQVRRLSAQARPPGWRLPSVLKVIEIYVPASPYVDTLPKEV